jgi:DNA-binding NarL/FixJ family response regulator
MSRAHGAAASLIEPSTTIVSVAIYSADLAFRLRLEQLLRVELGYTVAGVAHDPSAVSRLIEQTRVETVVAHAPPREELTDWGDRHPATTFVVIARESNEEEALDALYAGASAILPRSLWQPPTQRVELSERKSSRQIPSSNASPSLILGAGRTAK